MRSVLILLTVIQTLVLNGLWCIFSFILSRSHLPALSLLAILLYQNDSVVSPSFPMSPCPVLCLFVWSLPLGHCSTSVKVRVYLCASASEHAVGALNSAHVSCQCVRVRICVCARCNQCVISSLRPLFHTAGLEPLEGFCAIQASFALSTWPGGVCACVFLCVLTGAVPRAEIGSQSQSK